MHNSKNRNCNNDLYTEFLDWTNEEIDKALRDKTDPRTKEPLSQEALEKLKTHQKHKKQRNKQKRK